MHATSIDQENYNSQLVETSMLMENIKLRIYTDTFAAAALNRLIRPSLLL